MSLDRLIEKIAELKNPTVAGLDPKLSYIPDFIKQDAFRRYGETLEGAAEALLQFNRGPIFAISCPPLSLSALIMKCTVGQGCGP